MEYGQFCPIAKAAEIIGKMVAVDYQRAANGQHTVQPVTARS